jgi:hypothetical protein
MDDSGLSRFLERVTEANRRYEEIARITGGNFNIFNVLRISGRELIHSEFLAMLLDPEGVHGKGNLFVKLFLDILKNEFMEIKNFSYENLKVNREFPTKYIEEYKKWGNIDIAITDKKISKKQIFIENKIYAKDQPRQLAVYHKANQDAIIIYLTLDGHDPNEDSTAEGLVKPIKISYAKHILSWLDLCKKESGDHPFLRETMAQYILLIKQLTGQTRSREMEQDIVNAITENERTLSAFFRVDGFDRLKIAEWIIENKLVPRLKEIGGQYGLEFIGPPSDEGFEKFASDGWGFYFGNEKWKNIDIVFNFYANLAGFAYGFGYGYYKTNPQELEKLFQPCEKDNNFLYRKIEEYSDWKSEKVLLELYKDGNDVIKTIESKIKELLSILDTFKEEKTSS